VRCSVPQELVLETGGELLETRLNRVFAFSPASPKERKTPLDGVSLGDWATVTNTATGAQTFARVEDRGSEGGIGEISQLAATNVGIQDASSGFTIGLPARGRGRLRRHGIDRSRVTARD